MNISVEFISNMRRLLFEVGAVIVFLSQVCCFGTTPRNVGATVKKYGHTFKSIRALEIPSSLAFTKQGLNKRKAQTLVMKSVLTQEAAQSELRCHNKSDSLLVPIAINPLILSTTGPLLLDSQCQILSKWCRKVIEKYGALSQDVLSEGLIRGEEGAQIMKNLQKKVHEDLLGLSTPCCSDNSQDNYVIPRFIYYDETDQINSIDSIENMNASLLLPDGLHVDTNNSKHFRHFTILFYLNSCTKYGATTFPLAMPFVHNTNDDIVVDCMIKMKQSLKYNEIQEVARQLILEDVQHTRMIGGSEDCLALGRLIENEALQLLKDQNLDMGVRVIPNQAHACVFSNINDDGYPNPLSFHGGEAMHGGESKEVLTFFYEIDPMTFSNQSEFGQRAKERERNLMKYHFSN